MVVIVRKIAGYFREIVWLVKYYEPFGQIFALLKIRFLTAPAGPIVDGLCLKVLSEQKVSKAEQLADIPTNPKTEIRLTFKRQLEGNHLRTQGK